MDLLRKLPKVDEVLKDERIESLVAVYGRENVVKSIRASIDEKRREILEGKCDSPSFSLYEEVLGRLYEKFESKLKRVINGTGIVIHTNLGRSLICEEGIRALNEVAGGYSNLEFNLKLGERGSRYDNVREYIREMTGAEDVVVVNNNAAAVLLLLSSICKDKECIISRGELVEIGGAFRIPDIMSLSGGILKEVGTTNRTHLKDYVEAIGENTGAIFKVHTSNYKIMGFTKEVSSRELEGVCRKNNIPLIEDLGSGLLVDLGVSLLDFEETVKEKIAQGVDVLTFSGDKLLGGPQCGIIVGKAEFIEKIKKNQLNRALRVDKFTLAALEGTLREYLLTGGENIPTLKMLRKTEEEIRLRVEEFLGETDDIKKLGFEIFGGSDATFVGGGALPMAKLPTYVIYLSHREKSAKEIEEYLRGWKVPIIARISKEKVIIDGRTLLDGDYEEIRKCLLSFGGRKWETLL